MRKGFPVLAMAVVIAMVLPAFVQMALPTGPTASPSSPGDRSAKLPVSLSVGVPSAVGLTSLGHPVKSVVDQAPQSVARSTQVAPASLSYPAMETAVAPLVQPPSVAQSPTSVQPATTAPVKGTPIVHITTPTSQILAMPASTLVVGVPISTAPVEGCGACVTNGYAEMGASVTFHVNVSGGTGIYTYSWSINGLGGCTSGTGNPWVCTPDTSIFGPGLFSLQVTVTDSSSNTGYGSANIRVYAAINAGLTLSPQVVDVGQALNFQATQTGGQPGGINNDTLTWAGFPYGCQNGPVDYYNGVGNCPVGASGQYNVTVTLTDPFGVANTSSKVHLTSYPAMTTPVVTNSRPKVDIGYTTYLNASTTGGSGSGTYTWTWSGLPQGCVPQNSSTLTCSPTAKGSYSVGVWVKDVTGSGTLTSYTSLSVSPHLSTGVSASPPTTDVGSPTTFTAAVSGGSGGFIYIWAGLPQGCNPSNVTSLRCSPSQAGPYLVQVTVKDSFGYTNASPVVAFTVHSPPAASLTENRTLLDLNESIGFNATASGGTGVYTYTWNGLPPGCASQNVSLLACTPSVAGGYFVNVTVTDTAHVSVYSSNVSFSVNRDPIMTSLTSNPTAGDNPSLTITVTNSSGEIWPVVHFSRGTPNYHVCLDGPGSAWGGITVNDTACAPWGGQTSIGFGDWWLVPGTFKLTVSVLDSTGWNTTFSWNLTVYWPLSLTPGTSTSVLDKGMPATFNAAVVHGPPPFQYWWNDTTLGSQFCSGTVSTDGTVTCSYTPSWTGQHTIALTVRDTLWAVTTTPGILTTDYTPSVNPDLAGYSFGAKTGTYSAAAGGTLQTEIGATIAMNGSFAGGTGPYTCVYSLNNTVLTNTSTSTRACPATMWTPSHGGSYTLSLGMRDLFGQTINGTITVLVTATLSISAIGFSVGVPDAGTMENISVAVNGGLPAYGYSWSFGDGNSTATAHPWVPYSWERAGTYTVSVIATDGSGIVRTQSAQLQVVVGPNSLALAIIDGPISMSGLGSGGGATLPNGTTTRFNLSEAGGVSPFSYVWTLNGKVTNTTSGASAFSEVHLSWKTTGNHTLVVTVTDGQGMTSTLTVTVKIIEDTVGPVTVTVVEQTLDAGMWGNLTSSVNGGFAPYTYDWEVIYAQGIRWYNGSSQAFNATWNLAGIATVSVTVVDAFHAKGVSTVATITVNQDPSSNCAPSSAGVPQPRSTVTLTLSCLEGGTGPFAYSWTIGNYSKISTSNSTTVTFTSEGIFNVSVNVRDALGLETFSKTLALGTFLPEIANISYASLGTALHGGMAQLTLQLSFVVTDPADQFAYYRYAENTTGLGNASWTVANQRIATLNVSTAINILILSFEAKDTAGRVSVPYQLPVNVSSLLAHPPGRGPGSPNSSILSLGETFLFVAILTVVALAIVATLMMRRSRKRRGSGQIQASVVTSAPPDVLTPAIAAELKESPGQTRDVLAQAVSAKTGASADLAGMQIDQLASTGVIKPRWENGEDHYYPLQEIGESAEMDAIRKETETRSAVYSALEGKDWTGVEALHNDTQAQTGMTMVAFARWLDDHHVEYDIEMRTSGKSLEFRTQTNKLVGPVPEDAVVIDQDALSAFQHEPVVKEPLPSGKGNRKR